MTTFADYSQILLDLQTAVEGAGLGFKRVFKNADDNDWQFQNMPCVDFRYRKAVPEALATGTYYVTIELEAEIACFDMTSRDKSVTIRDNLTNALQGFLRDNQRFSGSVETTIVGDVQFAVGESQAQGEFVSASVLTFFVSFYS